MRHGRACAKPASPQRPASARQTGSPGDLEGTSSGGGTMDEFRVLYPTFKLADELVL
jgi:hypothetical protein